MILGKPFDSWVTKQVETRQMSLGKNNLQPKDILYQNSKTPFLRLASSVNLTNKGADGKELKTSVLKKLIASGIDPNLITNDELAQNFILQAGSVSTNTPGLKSGLNNGNIFDGAYGWGGTTERGYVPMPGITQADVTYYNNGALSKTTINVRCYSKAQFQLFDVLYLRPGYTLLMEFGWSKYLSNMDNEGNYTTGQITPFKTTPLSLLMTPNKNTSQYSIYEAIEKERKTYDGNYDAIYGKISKFNWQFNSDGSYDCQIQLTAVGDVIESLKTNITPLKVDITTGAASGSAATATSGSTASNPNAPQETTESPLVSNKDVTIINQELWKIYQSVNTSVTAGKKQVGTMGYEIVNFRDHTGKVKTINFPKSLLYITGAQLSDYPEGSDSFNEIYIKYGAFLAFIQAQCLLYDKKTETPLFTFDMNFDDINKDENIILTIPGQISADPRICLQAVQNSNIEDIKPFPTSVLNDKLNESSFLYEDNPYLGRISNIFVNINYIAEVLKETPIDDDGKISLIDFLKNINSGMIKATGGINKYEFKLDQSGLKIQIIEEIPQRLNYKEKDDKFAKFNVFGVKPGVEGSFIKNIELSADLSSDFASMISIGAQSSGNQLSENATSFSNYNAGLKDRIITEKVSSDDIKKQTGAEDVVPKEVQLSEIYISQEKNYDDVYNKLFFLEENISSLKENFTTATQLALGILTSPGKQQLNAPFFLPFNLSLDMDGLSGMKLYQKFEITDDVLPPSYEKDGVEIQISGINHSITSDAWITKLDTLSTPKFDLAPVVKPPKIEKSKGIPQGTSTNGGPGTDVVPAPGPQLEENELLRLRLTRVMDDGTQTLGYLDVLGEDEKTVLFTLATSELPWLGNQNNISAVPTDLYRIKSRSSGKYPQHFILDGNKAGNFASDQIFGNGYTRNLVLIHEYPKAPGWAKGCIGPGIQFNTSADQRGRQKGTGKSYVGGSTKPWPVVTQSYNALKKILDKLWTVGSFKMEIVNNGGAKNFNTNDNGKWTELPNNFLDPNVQKVFKAKKLIPNTMP